MICWLCCKLNWPMQNFNKVKVTFPESCEITWKHYIFTSKPFMSIKLDRDTTYDELLLCTQLLDLLIFWTYDSIENIIYSVPSFRWPLNLVGWSLIMSCCYLHSHAMYWLSWDLLFFWLLDKLKYSNKVHSFLKRHSQKIQKFLELLERNVYLHF